MGPTLDASTTRKTEAMIDQCGNERHPRGPWHPATPIPGSWQWLECFRYWLRRKRWGCGCRP